jgi:hypothetical protein
MNTGIVSCMDRNIFKGIPIEYPVEYHDCDRAEKDYADETQICANDVFIKEAYRLKYAEIYKETI